MQLQYIGHRELSQALLSCTLYWHTGNDVTTGLAGEAQGLARFSLGDNLHGQGGLIGEIQ